MPVPPAESTVPDGSEAEGPDTSSPEELLSLVRDSPFIDLDHPIGLYEGVKLFIMAPVVVIKWILLIVVVGYAWLVLQLLLAGHRGRDSDGTPLPLGPARAFLVTQWIRAWASFVLFLCGFYYVPVKGRENLLEARRQGAIVVINHISYVDPLVMVALLAPSGVSKSGVSELPLIGAFAIALQFVFVARRGTGDQTNVYTLPLNVDPTTVIAARAADPRYPPLMIAPEATTKTGECMLKFRRGAFVPGRPVVPVLLQYHARHFHPGWGVTVTPLHVWRLLSQFINHLSIEIMPPVYPNEQEKMDPSAYAARVRNLMAKQLGVPLVEQGVEHERKLLRSGIRPGPLGRRLVGIPPHMADTLSKRSKKRLHED